MPQAHVNLLIEKRDSSARKHSRDCGGTPEPVARSVGQREVQFEPVSQILDLGIHTGSHGLVEGLVLVDRVHPEHRVSRSAGGVELPTNPAPYKIPSASYPTGALPRAPRT